MINDVCVWDATERMCAAFAAGRDTWGMSSLMDHTPGEKSLDWQDMQISYSQLREGGSRRSLGGRPIE